MPRKPAWNKAFQKLSAPFRRNFALLRRDFVMFAEAFLSFLHVGMRPPCRGFSWSVWCLCRPGLEALCSCIFLTDPSILPGIPTLWKRSSEVCGFCCRCWTHVQYPALAAQTCQESFGTGCVLSCCLLCQSGRQPYMRPQQHACSSLSKYQN